jgi:putative PIG3 family NAD(P)H quinone oxidoreductase
LRAVLPHEAGREGPRLGELPDPVAGEREVLLRVRAAGLNRADLLQRRGRYPPPGGESEVPGLEAAGEIAAVGEGVEGWQVGDRAAALLAGGGQAELVAAPEGSLIRIPGDWTDEEAAALPEVALTAWTNLVAEGGLAATDTVLVAGATGAVGAYAVELAQALSARVIAAGRERKRTERLRGRGADEIVALDELPGALEELAPDGVDLVIDLVGGEHTSRLIDSLAERGRLVLVGLMAGDRAELDLGRILARRLELRGSTLRSRSRAEKADLVTGFLAFAGERLARRELVPGVARVFGFDDVADAYDHLANGRPFGKVVLRVAPPAAAEGEGASEAEAAT